MAAHPKLGIGDRVHWPNEPDDHGTVIECCTVRRDGIWSRTYAVMWDQGDPMYGDPTPDEWKDVNEVTERGKLTEFPEKDHVVLVKKATKKERLKTLEWRHEYRERCRAAG